MKLGVQTAGLQFTQQVNPTNPASQARLEDVLADPGSESPKVEAGQVVYGVEGQHEHSHLGHCTCGAKVDWGNMPTAQQQVQGVGARRACYSREDRQAASGQQPLGCTMRLSKCTLLIPTATRSAPCILQLEASLVRTGDDGSHERRINAHAHAEQRLAKDVGAWEKSRGSRRWSVQGCMHCCKAVKRARTAVMQESAKQQSRATGLQEIAQTTGTRPASHLCSRLRRRQSGCWTGLCMAEGRVDATSSAGQLWMLRCKPSVHAAYCSCSLALRYSVS